MDNLKQCTSCGEWLDKSEFNKNKNHLDGLQYWCRWCHSKFKKLHRITHKEEENDRCKNFKLNNKEVHRHQFNLKDIC